MAASEQDFMTMSDEEFAALPEDYFDNLPAAAGEEDEPDVEEPVADAGDTDLGDQEATDTDSSASDDTDDVPDDSDVEEDETDEADGSDDDGDDASDAGDSAGDDIDDDGGDDKPSDSDEAEEVTEQVDYKAQYEALMASFKANGKDMKVDTVEDARRLMQMGANYNKKMQGLKPQLKILKTLEKNSISEDKLNYLIDLEKKDPAAIARLVKESGIDPLEIDLDQSDQYTAADHGANETELALDEVISEIKDSPHYSATLDLVAKQWDATSKQAVVNQPQLMKVITDHMASGVYDLISTEKEKQQMLGQLNGMSDLEAYTSIGDAIQARNGFDHLFQPEQGQQDLAPAKPTPDESAAEAKRKNKKRAAGASKAAAPAANPAGFNPLALSDEEFEKQFPG